MNVVGYNNTQFHEVGTTEYVKAIDLPLGTLTVPDVIPVAVPSTAITVTVPPTTVTDALHQKGLTRATVEAGMPGAVTWPRAWSPL